MKTFRSCIAIAMWSMAPAAMAEPLTYTFQGVALDGGGAIAGRYDYDRTLNAYSAVDVIVSGVSATTTSGGSLNGTYEGVSSGSAITFNFTRDANDPLDTVGEVFLSVILASPMTAGGGTSLLANVALNECLSAGCSAQQSRFSDEDPVGSVTSVSSVPVPMPALLLGSGLLGLALLRRRG